jgi:alkylhydroperoxidase family enzyme
MDTYLPPIEKPGFMMRLAYAFTRKMFGKTLTPLKVVYARLPFGFTSFSNKVSMLDRKISLPRETLMLVREQVARINICLFCIDIGRMFTIKESMNQAKFDALADYQTNPLFTEADRAALDYATELTRDKQMRPETFARLAKHFTERQVCEIAWIIATEHYYNMVNIGLNIHSDMLCDIEKGRGKK